MQIADVVIGTLAASSAVLCQTLLERTQMVREMPGKSHLSAVDFIFSCVREVF